MKAEYYLFLFIGGFLTIATIVYGILSLDPTGTTALALSSGLAAMIGFYLFVTARRMEVRPEDRPDADISEGAGEVGFFSPGSYWPFGLALAASIAGLGLVFWQWWLVLLGLILVVFAACGLLFEYYSGTRHPAEH